VKVYKRRTYKSGATESVFIEMSQDEAQDFLDENPCKDNCNYCIRPEMRRALMKVLK